MTTATLKDSYERARRLMATLGHQYDVSDQRAVIAAAEYLAGAGKTNGRGDDLDHRIVRLAYNFGWRSVAPAIEPPHPTPFDEPLLQSATQREAARLREIHSRDTFFDRLAELDRLSETTWVTGSGGSHVAPVDPSSTSAKRRAAQAALDQAREEWGAAESAYQHAASAHTRLSRQREDYLRSERYWAQQPQALRSRTEREQAAER